MVRKQVVGLCSSVFLMMLGVGAIVALLPGKVISLSGSVSATAYLAALFAVPYVCLQVPCGRMADRFGFKPFLVAGYALCFLTGLLYCLAGGAGLLFTGRLLQGVGEAPVWALAPGMLSLQDPVGKGRLMGYYNASLHLGLTAGPLLGTFLCGRWTEGGAFLFYSAVCFLGTAIVALTVQEPRQNKGESVDRTGYGAIRSLALEDGTLFVLTGIVLYGACYGLFLTIIPGFLIAARGYGASQSGFFFMLFYLSLSVSQLVAGPLLDRREAKPFMICGFFMAAGGLGIFPGASGPAAAGSLVLASLGLGIASLSSMAYLNGRAPHSMKGSVSGAYYLFWGIGYFAGPLAVGELGKHAGFEACFRGVALVVAANAAAIAGAGIMKRCQSRKMQR